MIAPVFGSLASTYASEAIFVKMDGDQPGNKPTLQQYGVRGYPSFMFFRESKLLDMFSGANAQRLEALVKSHLVPPAPPEPRPPFSMFPETRIQLSGAVGNLHKAAARIRKTNAGRLTEEQLVDVERITSALDSKVAHIAKVAPSLKAFADMLSWPLEERFPCCDILRCLVCVADGAEAIALMRNTALDVVEPLLQMTKHTPSSKLEAASVSMALDVFVNALYQAKSQPFGVLAGAPSDDLLAATSALFPKFTNSYSKLILNRTVLATRLSNVGLMACCCADVTRALGAVKKPNAELLVAAGTLFWRYHVLVSHHQMHVDTLPPTLMSSVHLPEEPEETPLGKLIGEVRQAFELPL